MDTFVEGRDYYMEDNKLVLTGYYLTKVRKQCCGNGCRHCPYEPKHIKGNTALSDKHK
jgi:hypothetical protein